MLINRAFIYIKDASENLNLLYFHYRFNLPYIFYIFYKIM